MAVKELSVFFPAYNEQANIRRTVERALAKLEALGIRHEVVVVDDGSSDGTAEVVEALAREHAKLQLLRHEQNRGYGAALASGLYSARYEWICYTDADGQFDFEELDDFLAAEQETGAELIIGYYRKRQVSSVRRAGSWLWQLAGRLFYGVHVRNVDCGFKLIHRRIPDTIPRLEARRGAFVSTELLVKAKLGGFEIVEIPVTHFARTEGEATGASLDVIRGSFRDLFAMHGKLQGRP
jgi:glycosyltransferase involved in cell wall biosynthesis